MSSFVLAPIFRSDEFFAPFEALERLGDELLGRRWNSRPALKAASKADRFDRSTPPRKRRNSASDAEGETQDDSGSKFVVTYNVRGYRPEEISVKALDNSVVVSAKHEEESEDGCSYVMREFTRRFTLPEGVDSGALTCALSSSGVLAIEAPKPEPPSKKPRFIPIAVQSTASKKAVTDEKGSTKDRGSDSKEPTPESRA